MNNTSTLTLIQNAPTPTSSDEIADDFYNTLIRTKKEYPQTAHNKTIIMGDFNSNLSFRLFEEENIMSPHGYGSRNRRGRNYWIFVKKNLNSEFLF